jgi:hypothetical protein
MSRRHVLIVGFVAAVLAACETIRPLPIGGATSSPAGTDGALGPLQELQADAPLPSTVLNPARMCQVTGQLLADCDRARMLRSPEREVLVGYRAGQAEPAVAVSLSKIGSGDAQIVLALAVRNEGGNRRVSDVLTYASGGDLYGMPAYERGKDEFLRNFPGRAPGDGFEDIDAVTGATAISDALTKAIRTEAQALAALLADAQPTAMPQQTTASGE